MSELNPPAESAKIFGKNFYDRVSGELNDYVKYLESVVTSHEIIFDDLNSTIQGLEKELSNKNGEIFRLLEDNSKHRANGNVSACLMLEYHTRLSDTKKWLVELRENEAHGNYISGPKDSFINGVVETIARLEIKNENFEDRGISEAVDKSFLENIERIHKDIKETVWGNNSDGTPMSNDIANIRKYLGILGKTLDTVITLMFPEESQMRKAHQVRLRAIAMNAKLLKGVPVDEDSWVY